MTIPGRWRIGLLIVLLATVTRLIWVLVVPTIPVGDFATYRESAIYLAEFGHFDHGFVYMPGLVLLLAAIHRLGGEVLAAKLLGVAFGGLAAGPIYLIAAHLVDDAGIGIGDGVGDRNPDLSKVAPVACTAGLGYALWPAGIAMSSVIGTDIPAAAMMLLALSFLCAWGESRPRLAAASFGATMGVAAYFRAVALPLTVLSAAYWMARRVGVRATVVRTVIAMVVTALLLVPWGLRNRRQSGEMYLTDSHGGITALMGNDPNTEGTYSRSVGIMFHELTGRTFLSEPHRETDRAAYAIAKQWIWFDPVWTLGMIALRCERLFAPERGLLYWPLYRPGVVPAATAAWFNQNRWEVAGLVDLFYFIFVLGMMAGLAFAWAERRWMALVPLPFAVALAGTYALFVAEPRYRLTSEVLLFPLAALGLVRMFTSARRAVAALPRRLSSLSLSSLSSLPSIARVAGQAWSMPSRVERRALIGTLVALGGLALGALVVVRGGAAARTRHRWAATVWHVDGRPQLALWRGHADGRGPSPVRGAPPAVLLTLGPGRREVEAEIVLPDLVMPAGLIQVGGRVTWQGDPALGTRVGVGPTGTAPAAISMVSAAPDFSGRTDLVGVFHHQGGPVHLLARLSRPTEVSGSSSALIGDVVLTTAGKR